MAVLGGSIVGAPILVRSAIFRHAARPVQRKYSEVSSIL
jgi:hypothetical protein